MLTSKHDAFAVNPESAVNSDIFLHLFIAFHIKIMYNIFYMESYRSGHNEAHSKCVCPPGHEGSNPSVSVSAESGIPYMQWYSLFFVFKNSGRV